MSKIVFDIETVGVDFESLGQDEQEYILKYAEDEKKTKEEKKKVSLWPFTGQIAAICLLNPETEKGKVYFQAPAQSCAERSSGSEQAPGEKIKPFIEDGIEYEAMSEKEILEKFWQDIKNYQQFITFNGRKFDCPYLMLRSAILRIKPTRNLMPYRYSDEQHIDLIDQLTFYDAFRRFSLDFYAKHLGLKNSKTEGMSGEKIQQYFKDGKYLEIARYCAVDVKVTAELFKIWQKYIKI